MMKKGIVILVYAAVCPWPRKFPQRSNRAFFGDGLETAKTREYYKTGSQQFQHCHTGHHCHNLFRSCQSVRKLKAAIVKRTA
jgi:hypothetical protein